VLPCLHIIYCSDCIDVSSSASIKVKELPKLRHKNCLKCLIQLKKTIEIEAILKHSEENTKPSGILDPDIKTDEWEDMGRNHVAKKKRIVEHHDQDKEL